MRYSNPPIFWLNPSFFPQWNTRERDGSKMIYQTETEALRCSIAMSCSFLASWPVWAVAAAPNSWEPGTGNGGIAWMGNSFPPFTLYTYTTPVLWSQSYMVSSCFILHPPWFILEMFTGWTRVLISFFKFLLDLLPSKGIYLIYPKCLITLSEIDHEWIPPKWS